MMRLHTGVTNNVINGLATFSCASWAQRAQLAQLNETKPFLMLLKGFLLWRDKLSTMRKASFRQARAVLLQSFFLTCTPVISL